MLYPDRFDAGKAHRSRVTILRDAEALTTAALASEVPFRFVRCTRPDGRSRGFYVVEFGHGEIALEKSQVELVLLGFAAGLAVTRQASHKKIQEWVDQLVKSFEDGQLPRPWGT